MEAAAVLFQKASDILNSIPKPKRRRFDDVEVVFIDIVNGRPKATRAYSFNEVLEALERGGKPVGVILVIWADPDRMEMREFPGLSQAEQEQLACAFAEAQDEESLGSDRWKQDE